MKKEMNDSRRLRASRRLLDRSVLLDEREGPPLVRIALLFGTAIVCIFLIWASFVQLEEIETANGEIIPAEESRKIQHATGGIVTELPVREGSTVKAGQLLIRMDLADSESVRQQSRNQLHSLRTQRERLVATLENRSPDFRKFPPEAAVFVADQLAIFNTAMTQKNLALDMMNSQAAQSAMAYGQVIMRRTELNRALAAAEEDARITASLVASGAVAQSELIDRQRKIEALSNSIEALSVEAEQAQERAAEYRIKLDEYRAAMNKQLRMDLATTNERIALAEEQEKRLASSENRLEIEAPVDGIVHDIKYKTLGTIVPAGAVIMELIPTGKVPKAQIRIDPKSVGSLKPGNQARIKVSAYPFDRFGAFTGTLTDISASTFTSPEGRSYFQGIIEITGRELESSESLDLVAGMTLVADMRTGEKTLMQYLLKPIFASAREAFREK